MFRILRVVQVVDENSEKAAFFNLEILIIFKAITTKDGAPHADFCVGRGVPEQEYMFVVGGRVENLLQISFVALFYAATIWVSHRKGRLTPESVPPRRIGMQDPVGNDCIYVAS